MHLSVASHRRPVPPFANHTPRAFEFQKPGKLHQSSAMFGPTGLAVPVMLPATSSRLGRPEPSVSDQSSTGGSVSYASSRADVKSQDDSRPTSSESAVGEESRNPFIDTMMTQTNLLVLPPSNPSYQMAYFLKTTGPVKEPPIKGARTKKISSAMRIFKSSSTRSSDSLTAAHKRLNEAISEGNDDCGKEIYASQTSKGHPTIPEPALPEVVVPKVSKTGKKYFEIESVDTQKEKPGVAPNSSLEGMEPRVSVLVTDQLSTDSLHDWVLSFEAPKDSHRVDVQEGADARRGRTTTRISQTFSDEETIRILDGKTVAPVRPLFLGVKPRQEVPECDKHVRVIRGKTAPLRSHPITPGPVPNVPPPALPESKTYVAAVDPIKAAFLAHPCPRRLHGHAPVLQRTSSDVTGLRFSHLSHDGIRSVSDSPGPPPPRSPLRVSMQSESMDQVLGNSATNADMSVREKGCYTPTNEQQAIRVTKEAAVTYVPRESRDDDLPSFLRPGSSGTSSDVFCTNATQSKHGPSKPLELIDAMVKASQQNTSRRRLRRTKPEGPRPLDLSNTRSPESPEREQRSEAYCTSPLSIKRTISTSDLSENYRIIATTASPSPRISHVRKVPNARGRKSPVPRAKTARRGRSIKSAASTPSRAGSPAKRGRQSPTPDLPSPPPKKELPPTPQKKDHRLSRSNFLGAPAEAGVVRADSTKQLPSPPAHDNVRSLVFPSPPSSAKTARFKLQAGEGSPLTIESRMEALERRNRLLEAALSAVLKTGGMLNGCPCQAHSHECGESTAGESLTARGSVRSRVSSVSNDTSALDLYLNTRGK